MDANLKKYELIKRLVQTEDELLLKQVEAILEGSNIEFWDDLNPKLKESISRGLEQSRQGLGTLHDEVMKEFRSRLSK